MTSSLTIVKSAQPRLVTFFHYARHELKPPLPNEWPKIVHEINAFKNSFNARNLTVKEAIVYASVGVEVVLWFFAGEVIGRRHLLGYYVVPSFPAIHLERYHEWEEPEIKET
ncbi:ATP synthase subunit g, mitochondrial [Trichuris trichiura]|uniref:ATP synthase subunit g, mitochondrial n=1 Tax=Trichuris trichiura TaxID=36087 RepID=A0A077ZN97_TRITR|nr:ATP synthase subunit g, mitochondrial [Trichuris trichiura]